MNNWRARQWYGMDLERPAAWALLIWSVFFGQLTARQVLNGVKIGPSLVATILLASIAILSLVWIIKHRT